MLFMSFFLFFFFNDTATTEIYTLSLHDALPIYHVADGEDVGHIGAHLDIDFDEAAVRDGHAGLLGSDLLAVGDRKSTRLNSSHLVISYAVFCLKKKNSAQVHVRTI